ncbi:2-oxoacid:acceptor oxidoreductase family protein [Candidatus Woesearchaeota archaeon]|nr:2-oxoacid:acceptor oxidoreductase family protein [Candidatus Woesearchaeota archaeon]
MKDILEIRIHGRGGQGAKTASQFIVEAALDQGKYIKAFPEYGPERRGAPVAAFARISDKPIHTYAPITNPDIVLVIDNTLIGFVDVTKGLTNKGILIVNTCEESSKMKEKTKFKGNVYTVDATNISIKLLGKNLPNISMLGALVKIANNISLESLKNKIKEKFLKKIGEEKTEKTIESLIKGYDEVR